MCLCLIPVRVKEIEEKNNRTQVTRTYINKRELCIILCYLIISDIQQHEHIRSMTFIDIITN
jgi:hypothetical protein